MASIGTHPGTGSGTGADPVAPLRGLAPFSDAERHVFYGRDRDTEELVQLVTSRGFRAGLLYGESGVGKTSLLHAGLVPRLRDEGVIAVICDDICAPARSFVRGVSLATGLSPDDGERPAAFLTRAVAESADEQQFLFILDHVERALRDPEDSVVREIGDLFVRVVSHSGGRARFLFSCASQSVHCFGMLERRTGLLFPPSSRHELLRLAPADATDILERIWTLNAVTTEPLLSTLVVEVLTQETGVVLPADLQVAALAVRDLGISGADDFRAIGGAGQLDHAWVTACARDTGDERAALRLLGELASARAGTSQPIERVAARACTTVDVAHRALSTLHEKGLVSAVGGDGDRDTQWALAHPLLLPRMREIAAPVRAASRHAYALFESKAGQKARLSLRQYWTLREQGLVPTTARERAVVARSRRFFFAAGGAVVAVPVAVLIMVYIAMSGTYYLDAVTASGGQRVVVRAGSPGLTAFDWLPGSFGAVLADPGLSRPMVSEEAWQRIGDRGITGDIGDYAAAAFNAVQPRYRALIEYATSGSAEAVEELREQALGPRDVVSLLDLLAPIARGSEAEVELLDSLLEDASPAVQRGALAVATGAERRREGAYRNTLAAALVSSDADFRRLAFSAVSSLGRARAHTLYETALEKNPEEDALRELIAVMAGWDSAVAPSAASAAALLGHGELPGDLVEKAKDQLKRAFSADPGDAALAAANLVGSGRAAPEVVVFALQLMRDFAPESTAAAIADRVGNVLESATEEVVAVGLPLYARVAPKAAGGKLASMFETRESTSERLRVAMAVGWGEVARAGERAASVALQGLLEDPASGVRIAAAEAYGYVGRSAQSRLIKMLNTERFEVAVGAAHGLANSVSVGGSAGIAVSAINRRLWRRKGRSRHLAAQVFARMAGKKPAAVYSYLAAAFRNTDDTALRMAGLTGLCNASTAGHGKSRRLLTRAAQDASVAVRRLIIQCVADKPGDARTAAAIANSLAADEYAEIRADAARVLAGLVARGRVTDRVVGGLAKLVGDGEREVRIVAVRAVANLGKAAPGDMHGVLRKGFHHADDNEKLILLDAGQSIGATELIQQAIADPSSVVRIAAVDAAVATGTSIAVVMNVALADRERAVRRAALERLAASGGGLPQQAIDRSLRLAMGDADATIAQLALTAWVRLSSRDNVAQGLARALAQRSEQERMRAAAASIGLVERDPEQAVELLTPLLDDPSHDVRAAMLPALARAWAATHSADILAGMLRDAERHAMRRLTATAAFVVLARQGVGSAAARAALSQLGENGPPTVRQYARLALGLIESNADGLAFLSFLVP
ncbi:MAG: hypothetical protein MJE77_21595 [Proteobacteria bacterium]|nr:hypothetical protein [Pseudomonadota bacterium]